MMVTVVQTGERGPMSMWLVDEWRRRGCPTEMRDDYNPPAVAQDLVDIREELVESRGDALQRGVEQIRVEGEMTKRNPNDEMTADDKPMRLVFLDMEMTGLNPETDRILEVAAAIVEATPEGLAQGIMRLRGLQTELLEHDPYHKSLALDPRAGEESRGVAIPYCCSVVYTRLAGLAHLNEWSQENHENSGLLEEIEESEYDCSAMEDELLAWLARCGIEEKQAVLAGNTIHFDRAFIRRWMPDLDAYLHYRLFDISTLRQTVLALGALPTNRPSTAAFWKAHGYATQRQFGPDTDEHRALPDVIASIEELLVYFEAMGAV